MSEILGPRILPVISFALTSIQVLLFGTIPTWTDLLGAGLILLTVIAITTEKKISDMMCRGNDKETDKEQSGEENQVYKAEDSGDTITPILPTRNDFSYGSIDLINPSRNLTNKSICLT